MTRLLRLQFDMLGGNVRFHDGDPADPLAGTPLAIDVDPMTMPDIPVGRLKGQLEDMLRTHRKKLKVSESIDIEHFDPWKLTAAAMIWCIGDQILVSFRHLLDYLPRPLPDIVTISWAVRNAVHWTIMDHICQPGNKPCKLGQKNDKQYLWYVPSGEHGMWCVFGQYEGQWDWRDWPQEDRPPCRWPQSDGMVHYNKICHLDDLKLEVFFEDFDLEMQAVIVAQSPIHNYQAMPSSCKIDQWLAYHAASVDGRVLEHMTEFQAVADIVEAAVQQYPGAIQWASKALQKHPADTNLYH